MELILKEGKFCLFFIVLIVLAIVLLCYMLGKYGYKLHISTKKIEILPKQESPNKKH